MVHNRCVSKSKIQMYTITLAKWERKNIAVEISLRFVAFGSKPQPIRAMIDSLLFLVKKNRIKHVLGV